MVAFKLFTAVVLALAISVASAGRSLKSTDLVETISMGSYNLYRVTWMAGVVYDDVLAECGDQVSIVWNGNMHNVGIAEDGDCTLMTNVSEEATAGSIIFTLDNNLPDVANYGEIYFACDVGTPPHTHCEHGQKIEFYVDCSGAPAANATIAY